MPQPPRHDQEYLELPDEDLSTEHLDSQVQKAQEALLTLYTQALARFGRDRAAAEKLLAVGASPRKADLDPVELAAWTNVARVILNLHETITRM